MFYCFSNARNYREPQPMLATSDFDFYLLFVVRKNSCFENHSGIFMSSSVLTLMTGIT